MQLNKFIPTQEMDEIILTMIENEDKINKK